ncbi:Hypothetical predicted protein [Pelobates cultripes]|uniref:Uncharacterized protein n=1 Tax=Pelobates cultripes TaxID=61616 RepID=A0AAD1S2F7_PELCU|nr:Hypothetical predicted protein [Pelobates cultripes]
MHCTGVEQLTTKQRKWWLHGSNRHITGSYCAPPEWQFGNEDYGNPQGGKGHQGPQARASTHGRIKARKPPKRHRMRPCWNGPSSPSTS